MQRRRLPGPRPGRDRDLREELDEEIRAHIEMRTEALIEAGWPPEEARREAERRFGDLERARSALYASARRREARLGWSNVLEELGRDVRHALRQAMRSPGYASVAAGILGLGIALTTFMFALVDHVLLRPLPFPEPDRLVSLQSVGESRVPFPQVSMANWFDWRARAAGLDATGLYREWRFTVATGPDDAERVTGASVSAGFFEALRPAPLAGRTFTSEEAEASAAVAVVASGYAVRRFGSADAALGGHIRVEAADHEIIGVLPDHQALPETAELWVPEASRPGSGGMRNNISYAAIARLAPGATLESADAELDGIAQGIRASDPEGVYSYGVGVLPLRDVVVGDSAVLLRILMVCVCGVLLIACANLAGMGLARTRRRTQELAVRLALGSGRTRIARQLVIEHVVLAIAGGALGLGLTRLASGALFERIATFLPRSAGLSIDLRVAAFALLLSLLAGLCAGLLPALRAGVVSGGGLGSSRGTVPGGRGLPGAVLVAGEVALALAILVGGGLLLRSFRAVVDRELGYDPRGVVTAELTLTGAEYRDDENALGYWARLLENLEETPGVASAAVGNWIPTGGSGTSFLELPHDPDPDFGGGYRVVSEAYFETLGIAIVTGRAFGPEDVREGERVTLVNHSLAARAWPGQNPLGKRIRPTSMESYMYGGDPPWLTVIGVVGDVRHHGFEAEPRPELYVLYRQVPFWTSTMTAVVRPRPGFTAPLHPRVAARVRAIDPTLAVDVDDLERRVRALLGERRLTLEVLAAFSLAALLLTCLGVYGLVSYAVEQRTREMAIRAALGARGSGLLGLMLGRAGRVLVYGVVTGAVAARWLTGFLDSLLVGVTPADPVSYAFAAGLLGVVGFSAAFAPALRAARMSPVEALAEQ